MCDHDGFEKLHWTKLFNTVICCHKTEPKVAKKFKTKLSNPAQIPYKIRIQSKLIKMLNRSNTFILSWVPVRPAHFFEALTRMLRKIFSMTFVVVSIIHWWNLCQRFSELCEAWYEWTTHNVHVMCTCSLCCRLYVLRWCGTVVFVGSCISLKMEIKQTFSHIEGLKEILKPKISALMHPLSKCKWLTRPIYVLYSEILNCFLNQGNSVGEWIGRKIGKIKEGKLRLHFSDTVMTHMLAKYGLKKLMSDLVYYSTVQFNSRLARTNHYWWQYTGASQNVDCIEQLLQGLVIRNDNC